MEEADTVRALAALAHSQRLRIFRVLVVAGRTGLTPGALVEHLDIPATTLSFHLKELTHSGLVTQERQGRYLIYHASFDRMNALLGYLTANCCQGEAACLAETAASCKC
jgi:ArsR family transcriptional regulator